MRGLSVLLISLAATLPHAVASATCTFPVPADPHGSRAGRKAAVFALSSNRKTLAVSVHDEDFSAIFTFDLVSGKLLWSKDTGRGQAIGLALNPDGTLLIAAYQIRPSGCPHVELMKATTSEIAASLEDKADLTSLVDSAAYAAVFSPDGGMIAASLNGGIRVWSAATGKNLYSLEPPGFETRRGIDRVGSLGITPDSQDLIGTGTSLYLWHLKTGKLAFSVPATKPDEKLGSVAIGENGAFAAAGFTKMFNQSGTAVCSIPKLPLTPIGFEKDGSLWLNGPAGPQNWRCAGTKSIQRIPAVHAVNSDAMLVAGGELISISIGPEWQKKPEVQTTLRVLNVQTGVVVNTVSLPGEQLQKRANANKFQHRPSYTAVRNDGPYSRPSFSK